MKTLITMLAGLALTYTVNAQCSEISIDENPARIIEAAVIPDGGLDAEFFWYPAYNPNLMDEGIVLILRKISGPVDWTYSICRGDEFCVPILFGDSTIPVDDILESDLEEVEYDVQVVARSHGTAVLEALFIREFCPDDTVRQTLTMEVNDGTFVSGNPGFIRLSQNYPNPFNPMTNIPFVMLQGGLVSIDVYDLNGAKQLSLLKEVYHTAGEHSITFTANDLPSGSYYYQVSIPGESYIGQMTLIK
jgi:hypothetical protein